MKTFRVELVARDEFAAAAAWYEQQRPGLGEEFVAEVDHALSEIEHHGPFATAPIATIAGGVIRRAFVHRFPYVVVFVESEDLRRVIMIRRASSDPGRWRSRL